MKANSMNEKPAATPDQSEGKHLTKSAVNKKDVTVDSPQSSAPAEFDVATDLMTPEVTTEISNVDQLLLKMKDMTDDLRIASIQEWAARTGLTILEPGDDPEIADGISRYGITPEAGGDGDGWPNTLWNNDKDDCEDFDLTEGLSAHLADDEVAVLLEVGNEKLRYLTGFATAVNGKGETVHVTIQSIYELAASLGENVTQAEY